jgi:hypothetical protein
MRLVMIGGYATMVSFNRTSGMYRAEFVSRNDAADFYARQGCYCSSKVRYDRASRRLRTQGCRAEGSRFPGVSVSNDLANGSARQRENTDKDGFTSENAIVVCKEAFVDRDAYR